MLCCAAGEPYRREVGVGARGPHWLVRILPGTAVPRPGGVTFLPTVYVFAMHALLSLTWKLLLRMPTYSYVHGHACIFVLDVEAATTTVELSRPTHGRSLLNSEYLPTFGGTRIIDASSLVFSVYTRIYLHQKHGT